MKKGLRVYILLAMVLGSTIIAIPEICSQVLGAPGKGTGITVMNSEAGPDPMLEWSYSIIEQHPAGKSAPFTANFTLKTDGTGLWSVTGLKAGEYLVARTPEDYVFGYPPVIDITSTSKTNYVATGFSTNITLAPSEFKTLDFKNLAMAAFSLRALNESPPSDLSYVIPPLKPIPIQSTWDVDINNNGIIDLVAGKLTTILVNFPGFTSEMSVSIVFEGTTYSKQVLEQDLATTSILAFTCVPRNIISSEEISGSYQISGQSPVGLTSTIVAVKEASELPLYYVGLSKTEYGTESNAALTSMAANSNSFVNATYPIKNLVTTVATNSILGADKGTTKSPYSGMLTDAMAAAQQAQLYMGGSAIGIAIGPNGTGTDYFAYHTFPGAAGISFGPAVRGVVVLDGYYTAPAHEIGHVYGLYYGTPEQYQAYPPQGKTASGVSSVDSTWRTGYDFMGLAPYQTTSFTWVTETTYESLFAKTSVNPADPEILLVSGIVYSNGTVDTAAFPWYHLEEGIPDTLAPGDYSLDFIAHGEKLLNRTSFDLQFSVDFCPGIGVGSKINNTAFENRTTDFTGFSFATEFHEKTYKVQIMNNTDPNNPVIMATVYMEDVMDAPVTTSTLSNTIAGERFPYFVWITFAAAVLPVTFSRLIQMLLRWRFAHGFRTKMMAGFARSWQNEA